MFFKPRIFISSTLRENLTIRKEVEKHFRSCGAEPLLYEVNLTPSTIKYTYRTDILESDFVIFIIKDEYGTKTDTGLSGTHEELELAFSNNIPHHVYIKLDQSASSEAEPSKELKKAIDDNHISYFYYKDDEELLNRLKETTFTIAKEASYRNLTKTVLDKKTAATIALNYDYEKSLGIIKIIEAILGYADKFDLINTSLFIELESLFDWIEHNDWIFIDKKLQEMVESLRTIWLSFAELHGHNFCFVKIIGTISVPIWGNVTIHSLDRASNNADVEQCAQYISTFKKEFEKFCDYIKNSKFVIDKLNFSETT